MLLHNNIYGIYCTWPAWLQLCWLPLMFRSISEIRNRAVNVCSLPFSLPPPPFSMTFAVQKTTVNGQKKNPEHSHIPFRGISDKIGYMLGSVKSCLVSHREHLHHKLNMPGSTTLKHARWPTPGLEAGQEQLLGGVAGQINIAE